MPKGARSLSELLEQREEQLAQEQEWRREVGRTFTAVRSSRGQTQTDFAAELEVTQAYVSQIESGDRTPSEETLRKLQGLTEGDRRGEDSQ
jgi:ribosome-binding protein aMBF1 (putative translation factor)